MEGEVVAGMWHATTAMWGRRLRRRVGVGEERQNGMT